MMPFFLILLTQPQLLEEELDIELMELLTKLCKFTLKNFVLFHFSFVDVNERDLIENRVEAIQQVYKALTTRSIVIEFRSETIYHK